MDLGGLALSLPPSFLSAPLSFLEPLSLLFEPLSASFLFYTPSPPVLLLLVASLPVVTLLSITVAQNRRIFYYLVSLLNQVLWSLFFIFKVDECHTIFSY